jgi:5-methylcytosine-specific restriction endonuclease McrA
MKKICLGCRRAVPPPELTRGRCAGCSRTYEREKSRHRRARHGATSQRGYGVDWQQLAAAAIRAQPYCSACRSVSDLTVDHVNPATRGQRNLTLADVQVLCRRCNASKGGRGGRGVVENAQAADPAHRDRRKTVAARGNENKKFSEDVEALVG